MHALARSGAKAAILAPMAGRIVYLNGVPSAGKTSIGRALQNALVEPFLFLGVDTFLQMLPRRTFGSGWLMPAPEGGVRPSARMRERVRPPMLATLAALAPQFDLIVDDVIPDAETLERAVDALAPFTVLFVRVECALEVAEQRERERGDRTIGLARGLAPIVHAHGLYDLTVDSAGTPPAECAAVIHDRLVNGPEPTAFAELRMRARQRR
jgi:chloramphenicol 3-O phosphotransferase